MNLSKNRRIADIKMMKQYAQKQGKEISIIAVCFPPNIEVSKKRVKERDDHAVNKVPLEAVEVCAKQYQEPTLDEGYDHIVKVYY
jgi:hypothetical protein